MEALAGDVQSMGVPSRVSFFDTVNILNCYQKFFLHKDVKTLEALLRLQVFPSMAPELIQEVSKLLDEVFDALAMDGWTDAQMIGRNKKVKKRVHLSGDGSWTPAEQNRKEKSGVAAHERFARFFKITIWFVRILHRNLQNHPFASAKSKNETTIVLTSFLLICICF